MKTLLMSVFDSKVGAFSTPFSVKTRGEAIRSFTDACNDDKMPFKQHPADYRLFWIGQFDDETGALSGVPPEPLIGADELG